MAVKIKTKPILGEVRSKEKPVSIPSTSRFSKGCQVRLLRDGKLVPFFGTLWNQGPGIHGIFIQKHLVDTFTRYVSKDYVCMTMRLYL